MLLLLLVAIVLLVIGSAAWGVLSQSNGPRGELEFVTGVGDDLLGQPLRMVGRPREVRLSGSRCQERWPGCKLTMLAVTAGPPDTTSQAGWSYSTILVTWKSDDENGGTDYRLQDGDHFMVDKAGEVRGKYTAKKTERPGAAPRESTDNRADAGI